MSDLSKYKDIADRLTSDVPLNSQPPAADVAMDLAKRASRSGERPKGLEPVEPLVTAKVNWFPFH